MDGPRPASGREGAASDPGAGADGIVLDGAAASALRHDLRTPIHQILGYAEMLSEDARATGDEALALDLGKIFAAARRLVGIVERLSATPSSSVGEQSSEVLETGPIRLSEHLTAPPAAGAPADGSPASILIVDDNETNRDVLSRRIRSHGYAVTTAGTGEEALLRLEKEQVDLVLLDVVMPGLSGFEVLERIRRTKSVSDLPVIMATARHDSSDVVAALERGANDYVTKPLDVPVVLARLRTHLSLKRAGDRIATLAKDLEVRNRFIYETFGRYISTEIVERLLATPEGLKLGGETRKVTLLMSDLRGFTAIAEKLPADRVVRLLNNYLGAMADVILAHHGTIDEFIGDAILAIFGAPTSREDDAPRAVACAVAMQRAMERVNESNRSEGLPAVEMGIAVHTGEVVVGNIGSARRAKYGVVGSPVNLTARIESYTVGGQILISEKTLREAGEDVLTAAEVVVQMKGFEKPQVAHDVRGIGGVWGLTVPPREDILVPLLAPIKIRFAILKGKRVEGSEYEGSLSRLSMRSAEIVSSAPPPTFSSLRIHVVTAEGSPLPGDVYAMVTGSTADGRGFAVRFSSVPPEVRSLLESLVAASR